MPNPTGNSTRDISSIPKTQYHIKYENSQNNEVPIKYCTIFVGTKYDRPIPDKYLTVRKHEEKKNTIFLSPFLIKICISLAIAATLRIRIHLIWIIVRNQALKNPDSGPGFFITKF